jgi:hypothetical protein
VSLGNSALRRADKLTEKEAKMTISSTGLTTFVSHHRFRLTLGACVLALILMITVIYATIGFGPPWGEPALLIG